MSGWIKFDKDMAEDPRLMQAAESLTSNYLIARRSGSGGPDLSSGDALRFASNALRGALVTVWCYADTHVRNDDTLPLTSQTLDALVGIEGFCELLEPTGWLVILDDGTVQLPGYCSKNSLIAKRKAAENNKARQAAFRARNNAKSNGVHNNRVTPRVTRYPAVTKHVDQDQDQDLKRKKVPSEPVEPERSTEVAKPPAPKLTGKAETVDRVFQHWRETHRHPRASLDEKRRKTIRRALEHYSEADLCQAITGYRNSPHHMGQNDRATVYDDLELMLQDSKHIDAGLRFYAEPPRTDLSAKTRQNVAAIADWMPPEVRNAGG